MVYVQPKICPGKWDVQTPLGFWDRNGSPDLGQMIRPCNNQQKKENLPNCWVNYPQSKIERKWKEG